MEPAISVVARQDGSTAVWRVSLLPGSFGQMTGAWVLPDGSPAIGEVTAGSAIVSSAERGITALGDALGERLAVLAAAFDAYRGSAEPLAAPVWPSVPGPMGPPPAPDRPPAAERALVQAQALALLLQRWADAEDERDRVHKVIRGRLEKVRENLADEGTTERRRQTLRKRLGAAVTAVAGPLGTPAPAPSHLLTDERRG